MREVTDRRGLRVEDIQLKALEVELKAEVSSALANQVNFLKKQVSEDANKNGEEVEVTVGTSCKNGGCKQTYDGVSSSSSCRYHPGYPVFHEGLKFWSCCQRRTTDFNTFLEQEGCAHGEHVWVKEKMVDIKQSTANMLPTKLEIKLRKTEPGSWSLLNFPSPALTSENTKTHGAVENLVSDVDAVDLSDI
ncbi:Cysteine and histidine-rich domain-containing protein [Blattella germanica]|nr:Cysteine and histidine-rich domain-containing protein [Blattella germanica]